MRSKTEAFIVDPYWRDESLAKVELDWFDVHVDTDTIEVVDQMGFVTRVPYTHWVEGRFATPRALRLDTYWWVISDRFQALKVRITTADYGRSRGTNEYGYVGMSELEPKMMN